MYFCSCNFVVVDLYGVVVVELYGVVVVLL